MHHCACSTAMRGQLLHLLCQPHGQSAMQLHTCLGAAQRLMHDFGKGRHGKARLLALLENHAD